MSKRELSELMPNSTFSFPTFFLLAKRERIKWNGNASKSEDMGLFSFDTFKSTAQATVIPKDSSSLSF